VSVKRQTLVCLQTVVCGIICQSFRVMIKYTSNMAVWFFPQSSDITSPHVRKVTVEFLCFQEYLARLDPSKCLGLNEDSIHSFSIGDLVFGKGRFSAI